MGNIIYVVGMGPGKKEFMTAQEISVIEKSDVIVGYDLYVKLLKESFPDKEYMTTGMKREIERCELCVKLASEGKNVALICSGDAGVYGMASPLLEILPEESDTEVFVVPGITAALSGAALLGAPLNHDFCLISLSDLLTPFAVIEKRLRAAIQGDFAISIYNPASKGRPEHLKRACEIMMDAGASKDRICGYVENIGRDDTKTEICTLEELSEKELNMFTTVFVGNSKTYEKNGKMITKRGYNE
ncbi:MAG: precorrin-3B C(17)-methyltransferase [Lachnospiraceae bacterium]|nr:precorrin-3B C(17)-methyltransferase [Lachnospiraceae bacterium]